MLRHRKLNFLLIVLVAVLTSCGRGAPSSGAPAATQASSSEAFSAAALSSASVRLEWQSAAEADGYLLEGSYGDDEFFTVAELSAERGSFTHFPVPGSTQIDYRLSARTGTTLDELETVSLSLPELSPNPLVVEPQAYAPPMSAFPQMPALPTIDPLNPDPAAMATAMAALSSLNPDDILAQAQAVPQFPHTEIGPEGGEVTLTAPNNVIYTLTFPAQAVDEPTAITLVPIESVAGLPFAGGLLAGVQVQPSIPFAGPLRLTITLPPDSPADRASLILGFAVSSLSHELSLAPIYDAGPGSYSMNIYWGDALGLAAATPDEVAAQAARIPMDTRAQMAQQLAALRAVAPDGRPDGDAWIAAQVMQGILQQTESLAGATLPGGRAAQAAPVTTGARRPPAPQSVTAAELVRWVMFADPVYDWLNQMLQTDNPVPAAPPPGEMGQMLERFRTRLVEDLAGYIKTYIDDHDGCRTGLGIFAESLRQILRSPATPFQRALAANYRARFGPPPELQCEFRLQITRSAIREFRPGGDTYLGDDTETYAVHSEPWPVELDFREGRFLLRGPVGVVYDSWEVTHSNCPPTMQLRPFPSSLVWITDLTLVFDDDDRVSDFVLQGVAPDQRGSAGDSRISTDQPEPDQCRVLSESPGTSPLDVWGLAFGSLHNPGRTLDNWAITGDDSYVATDTIAGRVEGDSVIQYTEDTTIVLTVNQK